VQIGQNVYRHGAASVERDGRWRIQPRAPGFVKPQGDQIYGLAGMRAVPLAFKSIASVVAHDQSIRGAGEFELIYRLPSAGARFHVQVGEQEPVEVRSGSGEALESGLLAQRFEGARTDAFKVLRASGEPEIYGVVVEGSEPGVVMDTLGINGARIATTLAWDAAAFQAEVARRHPSLVILSYGTNEVGDAIAPHKYKEHYRDFMARFRVASPEAACWIMGPTERAAPDWSTNPRALAINEAQRQVADELGCAFFDTIAAMGGPGSLHKWAYGSPALARKDRVHLTPRGYELLGDAMTEALLGSYTERFGDSKESVH
jgi:lysophospholipase L1-like esterase